MVETYRKVHADPDVFCVKVPLPGNALREVNSYVICDDGDSLIVDTGFDTPEGLLALSSALADLGVDAALSRLFVTHEHTDHYGLLARMGARRVLMSAPARQRIQLAATPQWIDTQAQTMWEEGFSKRQVARVSKQSPAINRMIGEPYAPEIVADGDRVGVGRYEFVALATPGHAEGHLCLYLPERELMLTGDHVLFDISPNIAHWVDSGDNLAAYLASLEKVRDLPVSLALPGHREPRMSIAGRVDELLAHHRKRLDDCILALSPDEGRLAVDIAARMRWAGGTRLDDLNFAQQLFAAGEARAHLEHLVGHGTVWPERMGGQMFYTLR